MALPKLTIREVAVRAVDAPLDPPLRNSLNTIPRAPLVIAEVRTREGVTGNAYVFPYTPAALGPTAALARNIGAGLAGRPLAPASLWAELHNGGFLDEQNKPGAPYFGMQMVRALMNFNDSVVTSSSNSSMLAAHAAKRADGSVGVLLINKDAKNATTVKLSVNGGNFGSKGARFDYGKSNPPDGMTVQAKVMEGLSNSISIPMPPLTATVIVFPKAQ